MKTFLFLLLFLFSGLAQSNIFDMGEHSGFIKDSGGNLYKVNAAGTVSAIKTGTDLVVTERPNIPTSKGFYSSEIVRTAPVEVSRLGKTVRTIAAASGPVGLTLTAVSLICELTSICEQAGSWLITPSDPVDQIKALSDGWFMNSRNSNQYKPGNFQAAACSYFDCSFWTLSIQSYTVTDNNVEVYIKLQNGASIAYDYANFHGTFVPGSGSPASPTTADWDAKESLLNDSRFIDLTLPL